MDAREQALHHVATAFLNGGYVRGPIPERMIAEGWRVYKKGWEMRISLPANPATVARLRAQIDLAGIRLARVHTKGDWRVIQPIYGREQVLRVLRAAGIDTTGM